MTITARVLCTVVIALLFSASAQARTSGHWVTSWATAVQGPFPSGAVAAQPDQNVALPDPARGARDQSMRMIVRPSVWGTHVRIRFSNMFGSAPLTIGDAFVGMQSAAATLVRGSNRRLSFGGKTSVTIAAGSEAWSDALPLPSALAQSSALREGRKLAISFHVVGESGPITWHAKAMQTSYLSNPGQGSHGAAEGEAAFPNPITSWLFVDAVDMRMSAPAALVVCLGDSITDGSNSTLNGDDRWPDQLQRRFDAAYPGRVAVIDMGIGSNRILGPTPYSKAAPFGGGPSALDRLERDVVGRAGVKAVIWMEGVNDLSNGASAEEVIAGLKRGVAMMRAKIPGVRVIGATLTPSLGSKGNSGTEDTDKRRRVVNDFIRTGGLYDGVVDFEKTVIDPATGALRREMNFNTTIGGPGDSLHPNRAGYLAMAEAVDLAVVLPGWATGRSNAGSAARK